MTQQEQQNLLKDLATKFNQTVTWKVTSLDAKNMDDGSQQEACHVIKVSSVATSSTQNPADLLKGLRLDLLKTYKLKEGDITLIDTSGVTDGVVINVTVVERMVPPTATLISSLFSRTPKTAAAPVTGTPLFALSAFSSQPAAPTGAAGFVELTAKKSAVPLGNSTPSSTTGPTSSSTSGLAAIFTPAPEVSRDELVDLEPIMTDDSTKTQIDTQIRERIASLGNLKTALSTPLEPLRGYLNSVYPSLFAVPPEDPESAVLQKEIKEIMTSIHLPVKHQVADAALRNSTATIAAVDSMQSELEKQIPLIQANPMTTLASLLLACYPQQDRKAINLLETLLSSPSPKEPLTNHLLVTFYKKLVNELPVMYRLVYLCQLRCAELKEQALRPATSASDYTTNKVPKYNAFRGVYETLAGVVQNASNKRALELIQELRRFINEKESDEPFMAIIRHRDFPFGHDSQSLIVWNMMKGLVAAQEVLLQPTLQSSVDVVHESSNTLTS